MRNVELELELRGRTLS